MQDRADPHARERAFDIAHKDPPPGVSTPAAAAALAEVLDSIGDTGVPAGLDRLASPYRPRRHALANRR
jgi:hypothetical protein